MASTPTYQSNPYADFDPSQWTNPYSNFQNSAIPFPATYAGWPTDASGNPIQPTPGMTLNSSPAQPAAPAAATPSNPLIQTLNPAEYAAAHAAAAAAPAAPAAAPAVPTSTPLQVGNPLTSQQYLQLRANPGHVTTQGATAPQAASASPMNSNVLQQFLANWNPAQSGPGSGFQQAFSKALRGST
jgi:hypothetical protein